MKGKKGTITIFIVFFFLAVIIVVLAGVLAPMGINFQTEIFEAGEDIIAMSNSSAQNIQDASVRAAVDGAVSQGSTNAANNIEVFNFIFRYGWVAAIMVLGLVVFLLTRQSVEQGNIT